MQWKVETFPGVKEEIEALPPGLQGRLLQMLDLVERVGLEQMREPHARHLEGKMWELRISAREGIARGIYVTMSGRRVVVLHVFVKKTQKTPARALTLARARLESLT